jgi:uncharacterized protein (TIGR00252 family)
MATARREAGDAAEQAALDYLREHGLKLIARNYSCRGGEIDLVMLERNVLTLVEVRLRGDARFGGAAASVTARKQQRITIALIDDTARVVAASGAIRCDRNRTASRWLAQTRMDSRCVPDELTLGKL